MVSHKVKFEIKVPTWFKSHIRNKKYECKLGFKEWYTQLNFRFYIECTLIISGKEGAKKLLQEIENDPIVPVNIFEKINTLSLSEKERLSLLSSSTKKEFLHKSTSVRDLTRYEAYNLSLTMKAEEDEKRLCEKYCEDRCIIKGLSNMMDKSYNDFRYGSYNDFLKKYKNSQSYNTPEKLFYVVINLSSPDKLIIDGLENILNKCRSEEKSRYKNIDPIKIIKGKFSDAMFNQWHSHKILQYLDLCLYMKLNNIKEPTNEEIAEILDISTAKFNSNTKPLRRLLMEPSILTRLSKFSTKKPTKKL